MKNAADAAISGEILWAIYFGNNKARPDPVALARVIAKRRKQCNVLGKAGPI
jgi:hypothetical protein